MKPASAKQKGRIGQKAAIKAMVDASILHGLPIDPSDLVSRSSGSNGEDIIVSANLRKYFPISVECKNIKAFSGKKYYQQACSNAGTHEPLVVIRLPRDKIMYSIIATQALMELYAELAKYKFKEY